MSGNHDEPGPRRLVTALASRPAAIVILVALHTLGESASLAELTRAGAPISRPTRLRRSVGWPRQDRCAARGTGTWDLDDAATRTDSPNAAGRLADSLTAVATCLAAQPRPDGHSDTGRRVNRSQCPVSASRLVQPKGKEIY